MNESVANIFESIKNDINSHKIILYMKGNKLMPQCGFSSRVVDILHTLNVPFETRDVLQDDLLRESIKEFSDWPTLPQLYINGTFIGGCDIVTALFQNGELQKIIES